MVKSTAVILGTLVALAVATSAIAAAPGASLRRSAPAGTEDPVFGWAVVRDPGLASYTLAARDGAGSGGQAPTWERQATGVGTVTFPNTGNTFDGVPVVTALTSSSRACVVNDWSSSGSASVLVGCHRADGGPADTPFSVAFVAHGDESSGVAYGYSSCGGTACDMGIEYDSTGGHVTVRRIDTGISVLVIPGMGGAKGDMQISATSTGADEVASCAVSSTGRAAGRRLASVVCRDGSGSLVDTGYTFLFTVGRGLTGVTGRKAATLDATRPSTSSYHPAGSQRFSSAGTVPSITRAGVGSYRVTLPGMPKGGAALVTLLGDDPGRCTVTSIRTDGTPQRVGVRCTRPDGTSADRAFSLSYSH